MDVTEEKRVYADYAASAPMSEAALAAFCEAARQCGNPSSLHEEGRAAGERIERAREAVAALIGASAEEIFFTSGGTEADNWAVRGGVAANRARGSALVTSRMEHPAVANTAKALEGARIVLLWPTEDGLIPPEELERVFGKESGVALVSVMTANNETGVIQPIRELARIAHRHGALFHTDAVQAAGRIPLDVGELGADLLSLSAHKLGGPAGIGALYKRKKTDGFPPLLFGGGQQGGLRSGTVPAALIAAFGAAAAQARAQMAEDGERIAALGERIEAELLKVPGSHRNGAGKRLPGVLNISFDGVEGEALTLLADLGGVAVSAGSACHAGKGEPSPTLTAMFGDEARARGAIRISVGRETTEEDAERIVGVISRAVGVIRADRGLSGDV